MNRRPTWTDCDEAGDCVVPNVLSPRDLVSRTDIMDKTVPHTSFEELLNWCHLGITIKVVSKMPVVITVVTIDKGLRKSTIGEAHCY